jgi:hypothetical protein
MGGNAQSPSAAKGVVGDAGAKARPDGPPPRGARADPTSCRISTFGFPPPAPSATRTRHFLSAVPSSRVPSQAAERSRVRRRRASAVRSNTLLDGPPEEKCRKKGQKNCAGGGPERDTTANRCERTGAECGDGESRCEYSGHAATARGCDGEEDRTRREQEQGPILQPLNRAKCCCLGRRRARFPEGRSER